MRTLIRLLASLPILSFIGWCASADAAAPFFMGLGDLPGGDFRSEAYGVSADGSVVVGGSRSAASAFPCDVCDHTYPEAFRWTAGGGMIGLGDLPGGAFFSQASGVSADGSVVVGYGRTDGNNDEAFRWTAEEGIVGLGHFPPGMYEPQSQATDVSANGSVVVGYSKRDSGRPEAFRWAAGGGMAGLGVLPGGAEPQSLAFGVSADGAVVVGHGFNAGLGFRAFRWTAADGMVSLGVLPGGTNSEAYDVSADGSVVVGVADTALGRYEPFRWTAADGMVSLGILPGREVLTYATGISADGSIVVGISQASVGNTFEAFVWDTSRGMRRLHDVLTDDFGLDLTGWTLLTANAISADGRTIVGDGFTAVGRQAWIATVPEPSALDLLRIGCGALTLIAARRRQ